MLITAKKRDPSCRWFLPFFPWFFLLPKLSSFIFQRFLNLGGNHSAPRQQKEPAHHSQAHHSQAHHSQAQEQAKPEGQAKFGRDVSAYLKDVNPSMQKELQETFGQFGVVAKISFLKAVSLWNSIFKFLFLSFSLSLSLPFFSFSLSCALFLSSLFPLFFFFFFLFFLFLLSFALFLFLLLSPKTFPLHFSSSGQRLYWFWNPRASRGSNPGWTSHTLRRKYSPGRKKKTLSSKLFQASPIQERGRKRKARPASGWLPQVRKRTSQGQLFGKLWFKPEKDSL